MTESTDETETMFRFFNEIGIIAQLSGHAFEKIMPGGLTLPQFSVLNHLARLGGDRTPAQIARAMQVTKAAMTNTLGHLQRARYIDIAPDRTDGRAKRVNLTAAGRDARQAAIVAVAPELKALAAAIGSTAAAEALPLLERTRAILDRRRD